MLRHPTPEPRGLRHRREELTLLEDAARSGSTQARMRVGSARRALERQVKVSEYRRAVGKRLATR